MKLPVPERFLSNADQVLATLIAKDRARWPKRRTEYAIWGLMRVVMAQQLSTTVACRIAERVATVYPGLVTGSQTSIPDQAILRKLGLSARRAECCAVIASRSCQILCAVQEGETWESALSQVKGIGPWTIAVFRIMVLRDADVLPVGDLGLERSFSNAYGSGASLNEVSQRWRPYRSVACWYLWRTLGNKQLG